jgi:hypothetical protein
MSISHSQSGRETSRRIWEQRFQAAIPFGSIPAASEVRGFPTESDPTKQCSSEPKTMSPYDMPADSHCRSEIDLQLSTRCSFLVALDTNTNLVVEIQK